MRLETKIVRAGQKPDPTTGAITVPIYQTSTYVLPEVGRDKGYDYSRSNTPTRRALEINLAALEGGKDAVAFSSGLAAINALMMTLSTGDHMLVCDDLYGGTSRLFDRIHSRLGLSVDYTDMTDLGKVEEGILPSTRFLFVETPSNPTLKMTDIKAMCDIARERGVKTIVDNTFMTPYFQRPLELGADIIVHSLTKFLSGHNDLIGGAVITSDEQIIEDMKFMVKSAGATLGPFDSYLTLRGIKTLAVRMDRHNENAIKVADFLKEHRQVERVIFPGFEDHPQYEIGKAQMTGWGGMLSFELEGGVEAGTRCMNGVKLWALAESLGGVESLITHPATMTHADLSKAERESLGITDGFVRLSVGLEDPEDLIEDLAQAIEC